MKHPFVNKGSSAMFIDIGVADNIDKFLAEAEFKPSHSGKTLVVLHKCIVSTDSFSIKKEKAISHLGYTEEFFTSIKVCS